MTQLGHNERSYRLDVLAEEARKGLANVEQGEEFTIGGWLSYGHALNEGRALFPGDREFGQWIEQNVHSQLAKAPIHDDRLAAMWAAANADQFEEARQRGNPRTIRGIHAKWKEIEKEREEEQRRLEAEAQSKADQENGATSDGQENKGDAAHGVGNPDAIGATQSIVDQETPSATQANPEDQPAPSKADAQNGGDGAGELESGEEKKPDPHAKLRAEFRAMTDEAQEEDWINLRADFAEAQKRIASQRGDIADLKARIKELSESNQGATISKLQKQIQAMKYSRDEAKAATKRMEYRLNKAEARVKELEGMEITL